MKRLSILFFLFFCSFSFAARQQPDWQMVEKVFGRKGTVQGDVFKIVFPRSDLRVKIDEVSIEPGLALTSWIALKQMGSQTMMMGDLVLLTSETAPVMAKLVSSGHEVTGLHNHILGESPNIMYMHYKRAGRSSEACRSDEDCAFSNRYANDFSATIFITRNPD